MKGHQMNSDKPGVKTTEFWAAIGSALAGALPAVLVALEGRPGVGAALAGVSLVAPIVYVWGRSILKAEQAKHTDVLSEKWENRLEAILNVIERIIPTEARK